jgi:signal-transduction protein with cAMP-binding, CBS, and nucleotidyltransferase domain
VAARRPAAAPSAESGTNQPTGLITEADIVRAVGDGKDLNEIRVYDIMTTRPTVVTATTTVRAAAETMTAGGFQHLPVVSDTGLIGMIDMMTSAADSWTSSSKERRVTTADADGIPGKVGCHV